MKSFSQAKVVNKSGTKLAEEITRDLKVMLEVRINAVKVENEQKVDENVWLIDKVLNFAANCERSGGAAESLR